MSMEDIINSLPKAVIKPAQIPWKMRLKLIRGLLQGRFRLVKTSYLKKNADSDGTRWPEVTLLYQPKE